MTQTFAVTWSAKWITHPTSSLTNYSVFYFRDTLTINPIPSSLIIYISADTRYRLFVNGNSVCFGPPRSDIAHWVYDSIDIAPYLKTGANIIAAQVNNFGSNKPVAQFSSKSAFIMQGSGANESAINTGTAPWKVIRDNGYSQLTLAWWDWANGWYAIGGTDSMNCSNRIWGWETLSYNDKSWLTPGQLSASETAWKLVPRVIPFLEESKDNNMTLRFATGHPVNISITQGFLNGTDSLLIPANDTVRLIVDQSYHTIGFPSLTVSQGIKSNILITYAESPYDTETQAKLNRNLVIGYIQGCYDKMVPDGGNNRVFTPLWFRVFRYVMFDIVTDTEPLVIKDYHNTYTAYPYQLNASFHSSDLTLDTLWTMCWRTARQCAFETFMDCPYYEQLNYGGDGRVQGMCSMYASGDDRQYKNSINQLNNSMMGTGILEACYPNSSTVINIPTYSLHFIGMLHDIYMYEDNVTFIQKYESSIKSILNWYNSYKSKTTGLLGAIPNWDFVDAVFPNNGQPAGSTTGNSACVSLIYVRAMLDAVDLFTAIGDATDAATWLQNANTMKTAVYNQCYDPRKQLFTDSIFTGSKASYSEHTNAFAILTDAIDSSLQKTLLLNTIADSAVIRCYPYFKFYFFEAMKKTNLGDLFVNQMGPWINMLQAGLSTFCEHSDPQHDRSDCHGWATSPYYDFLTLICGIQPAKPGFDSAVIKPSFGNLTLIQGTVSNPNGNISVYLTKTNNLVSGTVTIPAGLPSTFVYQDTVISLITGINYINLSTSTGMNSIRNGTKNVEVYPNPGSNLVHVIIPDSSIKESCFELFNIYGSKIISKMLTNENNLIDIGFIANGSYIYRISSGGMTIKNDVYIKQ